jgi:hypothetical protein
MAKALKYQQVSYFRSNGVWLRPRENNLSQQHKEKRFERLSGYDLVDLIIARSLNENLQVYKRILTLSQEELSSEYQLLCANCNWIKKYEENSKYLKWFGDVQSH